MSRKFVPILYSFYIIGSNTTRFEHTRNFKTSETREPIKLDRKNVTSKDNPSKYTGNSISTSAFKGISYRQIPHMLDVLKFAEACIL